MKIKRGLYTEIKNRKNTTGEFDNVWIYPDGSWIIQNSNIYPNPECYTNNPIPTIIKIIRLSGVTTARHLSKLINDIIEQKNTIRL